MSTLIRRAVRADWGRCETGASHLEDRGRSRGAVEAMASEIDQPEPLGCGADQGRRGAGHEDLSRSRRTEQRTRSRSTRRGRLAGPEVDLADVDGDPKFRIAIDRRGRADLGDARLERSADRVEQLDFGMVGALGRRPRLEDRPDGRSWRRLIHLLVVSWSISS